MGVGRLRCNAWSRSREWEEGDWDVMLGQDQGNGRREIGMQCGSRSREWEEGNWDVMRVKIKGMGGGRLGCNAGQDQGNGRREIGM